MGLSTHVLDTMHGRPAAGMVVQLFRTRTAQAELLEAIVLNADGRPPRPLLDGLQMEAGTYRLVFAVADYFRAQGVALPEPPFLGDVSLDFGMASPTEHYHVPLLVSPWSYSTYRGS